ncbi:hypothetical protein L195_g052912 [Trifolium pratense]|uniref:Uncharacterized protein n=1 Tax=Trifolium pratense TaxID=57577 RepID=A0A2K3K7P1_TRIPR|nr:hypothetical protein L195_g052912 [Trifolium pratense]
MMSQPPSQQRRASSYRNCIRVAAAQVALQTSTPSSSTCNNLVYLDLVLLSSSSAYVELWLHMQLHASTVVRNSGLDSN